MRPAAVPFCQAACGDDKQFKRRRRAIARAAGLQHIHRKIEGPPGKVKAGVVQPLSRATQFAPKSSASADRSSVPSTPKSNDWQEKEGDLTSAAVATIATDDGLLRANGLLIFVRCLTALQQLSVEKTSRRLRRPNACQSKSEA